MERDSRRDRSQWRGCHTFNNIICDGDQGAKPERTGGLKMGQKYYYYYELDGSTEVHDPSLPSTSACPYLPGQTVNTLEVPAEHQLRHRSASMTSLRATDYKTMNPRDKFTTPRPAPPVPGQGETRLGSSPSMALVQRRSSRSLSPAPRWAHRLFGKKPSSRDGERGRTPVQSDVESVSTYESSRGDGTRSTTPSDGVRSRDMSPESLRRFLSGDSPLTPPTSELMPKLSIPDEIVEEAEDDDNFATSATSETAPFTTLSPPPFLRSTSTPSMRQARNDSTVTIVPEPLHQESEPPLDPSTSQSSISSFKLHIPRSQFSVSTTSSSLTSPTSIQSSTSRDFSQFSFFDESEGDDEDLLSSESGSLIIQSTRQSIDETPYSPKRSDRVPFTGYSLPQATMDNGKHLNTAPLASPALVARNEYGLPVGNTTNLLSRQGLDTGLDDLVNDMGWMADVIHPKDL